LEFDPPSGATGTAADRDAPPLGWALLLGYLLYRFAAALVGPLPLVPQTTPAVAYDSANLSLRGGSFGTHALYMVPVAVLYGVIGRR
jgi:hypothetical protein